MFQLLLAIIYLSFISLGLPDSLLGSAWPSMYREFAVPAGLQQPVSALRVLPCSVFLSAILLFCLCSGRFPMGLEPGSGCLIKQLCCFAL